MTEQPRLSCVKTYDIRGRVPEELNEDIAYRVGRAYVATLQCQRIVIGRDVRPSGPALQAAFTKGAMEQGCDVVDLGRIGTEEMYFATFHLADEGVDGGVIVTASHNPKGYNGLKMVRHGAIPLDGDRELNEIERRARTQDFPAPTRTGVAHTQNTRDAYLDHVLGYIDPTALDGLTILSDAGHGCAGPIVDALATRLPGLTLVPRHHAPDGTFPAGIPNPLLEKNRGATSDAVRAAGADLGIAFDGDFDRCFFFDEQGAFVDGYYMVGLLAEHLITASGEDAPRIIHDPRQVWNTLEQVGAAGGVPVVSKTGHAYIKARMRKENALYGGEMSAHHYFRDFAYCDSGMIPWLIVAERVAKTKMPLSEMVRARAARFPVSGEVNRRVRDADAVIARVRERFGDGAAAIDELDGLSIDHGTWRFSIRKSNTEPLLRLNVETRGDPTLLDQQVAAIVGLIDEDAL